MRTMTTIGCTVAVIACLGGCTGTMAIRGAGQVLANNDRILAPLTLRGIDAAEAAGDLDARTAQANRDLVDANSRAIREMASGGPQ